MAMTDVYMNKANTMAMNLMFDLYCGADDSDICKFHIITFGLNFHIFQISKPPSLGPRWDSSQPSDLWTNT